MTNGYMDQLQNDGRILIYAVLSDDAVNQFRDWTASGFGRIGLITIHGVSFAGSLWNSSRPIDTAPDRVISYGRIVEQLFKFGDLLPVRFGSILTAESLDALAIEKKFAFRQALKEIDNCVEIDAHWTLPIDQRQTTSSDHATNNGRDYLLQRRRRLLQENSYADEITMIVTNLNEVFGEGFRDASHSSRPMATLYGKDKPDANLHLVTLRCLVRRADADRVAKAMSHQVIIGERPVVVSEPSVPYAFVGAIGQSPDAQGAIDQCKGVQRPAA